MTDDAGETGGQGGDWLLETERAARRRRRGPLSRAEIVAAALRIIDAEGLDALSMRRLGVALDVRAMAMYRHVRDKDQLLDLLIEGILREIEIPPLGGDWRDDTLAIARATRRGFMRHRHAVTLLASRPWVGPSGLAGIDAVLGVFRRAGASARTAVHAQFALGNFVTGFCAWEAANLGARSEDPAARAETLARYRVFVTGLPADRFPNLTALAPQLIEGSLDERFEAGLGFLLDGLARVLGPAGG